MEWTSEQILHIEELIEVRKAELKSQEERCNTLIEGIRQAEKNKKNLANGVAQRERTMALTEARIQELETLLNEEPINPNQENDDEQDHGA
jgi:hypothetical protein